MLISVVTPTRNRPEPLRRALLSLAAQDTPPGGAIEIVVVDNTLEESARAIVAEIAARSPHPVRYLVESAPGVASARNRGVREAQGDWIAFLDDDEEASPRWIRRMVECAEDADADAVFGPVTAKAELSPGAEKADQRSLDRAPADALLKYFSRRLPLPDGAEITELSAYLGTNNSLFRRKVCLAGDALFDTRLDATGGEDSLLLARLVCDGRRFAWSVGGVVTEWVSPQRLTWRYVWRRKYLSGQIRVMVVSMTSPKALPRIGFWMVFGLAQAALTGALGGLLWAFDRRRARQCLAVAAGGAGKIFWMRPFRLSLYGRSHVS